MWHLNKLIRIIKCSIFNFILFQWLINQYFIFNLFFSHFHSCLELVEVGVWIITELIVAARFNDLAVVDNEKYLAVSNGCQTMSYDNRCTSLHCSIKGLLNNLLGVLIQSGSSFIKNQYLWFLDECSRNCNPLFLSTRQLGSSESATFIKTFVKFNISFELSIK